jgi:hypothetical protein
MATVFTGGAMLIKHLERHAERVTEILALILTTCFALFACGLIVTYGDLIAADSEKKAEVRSSSAIRKMDSRLAGNSGVRQSLAVPPR